MVGSLTGAVSSQISKLEGKELRVVIGASAEEVKNELNRIYPSSKTILQEVRSGTGDAVRRALTKDDSGTVLVCAGDTPLITTETLRSLIVEHKKQGAAATVLTTEVPNPTGYGRIVREKNEFTRIVEERDASPEERPLGCSAECEGSCEARGGRCDPVPWPQP